MRFQTRLVQTGFWLATSALTCSTIAPVFAQSAPPPGADQPGAEQAGEPDANPPALAGRLAGLTGSVSFHSAGETQWNAATLNYPVTNGSAFWTEPGAQAQLEIADDRLVMDGSTELDVNAIDQSQISVTQAQGAVFLRLNSLPPGQTVSVTTPRGVVQLNAIGQYEIIAGDTNDATLITVIEGSAHVAGTNLALEIGPQQTATVTGSDSLQGSVGPMQQDAFLQSMLRVPAQPHFAAAVPPQVRYMTGAADLQAYGSFSQTAQYGEVWYPRDVARNWAPYRDGHWAYVQPWGWTWVDNARWGFAPFHYGRWVQVENRWGWVAGGGDEGAYAASPSPYPVYSPALVSFVGVGAAALASVSIGFGAGGDGYAPAWIPLGPREPYYPWYHCRPDYFGRINNPYGVPRAIIERGPVYNTNVTNVRIINNNRTNIFINQRAATVIPAAAFARGGSVASLGRPLPERALREARAVIGRLPVRPTAETAHLPPAAARRYNVALPAAPVRPVTAGPRIVPEAGQARTRPELRNAALPRDVHSVPVGRLSPKPGLAGAAPPGAKPELSSHGAKPLQPAHGPAGLQAPNRGAPLPALRAPGAARPLPAPVAPADRQPPGAPANHALPGTQPGQPDPRGREPRPGAPAAVNHAQAPRGPTGAPRSDAARIPQIERPSVPGPHPATAPGGQPRPLPPRAGAPAPVEHPTPSRMLPRTEPSHVQVEPHAPVARPAPVHVDVPRLAPRVERPRVEQPRLAPRAEQSRPAPRMEQPRPVPRVEQPRPAPRMEQPHPAPRMEPPRPAPHVQAPRPAPAPPHAAAPPPRPAGEPGKHPPK